MLDEIIENAEPRGLLDLPRNGTKFSSKTAEYFVAAGAAAAFSILLLAPALLPLSKPDWPLATISLLLLGGAYLFLQVRKDNFSLRGNQLFVENLGREKRIFLDQPYTYYTEGDACVLRQGRTKAVIRKSIDGYYNLVRVLQKEGDSGRLAPPRPNIKWYRRDRYMVGVIFAVSCGFLGWMVIGGFVKSYRVLEPMRLARKDPVHTTGLVIHTSPGKIRYEYTANGQPYEYLDEVEEAPQVGERVQVTYWREDPQMSHTSLSTRETRVRAFMPFLWIMTAVMVGIGALVIFQRKTLFEKKENVPLGRGF